MVRNWLAAKRAEKGASMATVAKAAGITQPAYFYIEKGDRNPSVAVAKNIARILDFPWTKFFEES